MDKRYRRNPDVVVSPHKHYSGKPDVSGSIYDGPGNVFFFSEWKRDLVTNRVSSVFFYVRLSSFSNCPVS